MFGKDTARVALARAPRFSHPSNRVKQAQPVEDAPFAQPISSTTAKASGQGKEVSSRTVWRGYLAINANVGSKTSGF
ncbi:hypothetical protein PPTG_23289 [Phytophthora nicotianae INRA-310]|uniref:Uncharacterized protein n=2 Tax=Phytophthora nicotianae TaxID=4792 RepID=W2Q248_PHYN3|nr:hypothetical protein PPTG_23289 [Phytophthora nicotianae INRA-310]ETM43243.1 hypothetical protein L914_11253 [Phytophthora nicotianae]ETN06941.1 hypothetical protein PPTG_23289 [Phytophthora nicotianae INRA-310]